LALISSIWNWAARSDEVVDADNPATARRIERYPENGRERYLTSEELGRLGDALRDSDSVGLPYAVDETKPGAKHAPKAEHRRVKLDPFAVAAIRLLILTGARLHEILDAPRADLNKPWRAIRKAANLKSLRIHDLRHTFASFGAGASLGLPIIGKLLGHSQAATTHRYAHLDADPMRRAVETIGATISAALDNKTADVVSLPKSRSVTR
jgi:integrase